MFGVTKAMRDDIEALMTRVFHEAQGVRVAVVVHGDYDSRQYSTMHIDFAQSAKPITVRYNCSDCSLDGFQRVWLVNAIGQWCLRVGSAMILKAIVFA